MTEEKITKITENVKNLIECRAQALMFSSHKKIVHTNNRYWDLLSFYQGQWHYITTLK
jgi:hypothetical protein